MACPIERRPYPPGEHGRDRTRQGSEYLAQLREKQKARRIYGVLEKQFRNLYEEANRQSGITGENLLRMLELRLDNVVFRALWGASRDQARQLVRHGHVLVNGKRVTIPSYRVRPGDVVSLAPGVTRRRSPSARTSTRIDRPVPGWLEVEDGGNAGRASARSPSASRSTPRCASSSSSSCTRSKRTQQSTAHTGATEDAHHPATHRRGRRRGGSEPPAVRHRPARPGFGHTLGNSLRRTLLSSIPGAAVTQVRFDDALHEFTYLQGVKEDVSDIILNLKDLVLDLRVRRAR